MSGKIQIEEKLNQVDVSPYVSVVVGNRTPSVQAWYHVAKDNLRTATLLLENDVIPHAIFFFQQCVECFVKGTFLECGALNKETTRQINHSPEKAYKALYKKLDYMIGLDYCDKIPKLLSKAKSFEDKLIIGANIGNKFTNKYWEDYNNANLDALNTCYINPTAMGLNPNSTPLQCHLRYLEATYAENMLLLLSCIFSQDVEQDVRYPKFFNNNVALPCENFCNKTIKEGLQTIIPILETIINAIIGDSNI